MSEQDFREIQLSGKQVVFLFMAFLVVGVVVFLLGVSVGRGVPSASPAATASPAEAATAEVPKELPPPTEPLPGELTYTRDLQGAARGGVPAVPPKPPGDVPPAAAEKTPAQAAPAATKPATPATTAKPAPATAKPTSSPASKPAPVTNGWAVQVNAFGSRENADREAARLKARGYPAFVFTAPGSGARYRVRVGPFADRTEADRAAARLVKEGLASKPSVIR